MLITTVNNLNIIHKSFAENTISQLIIISLLTIYTRKMVNVNIKRIAPTLATSPLTLVFKINYKPHNLLNINR